MPIRRKITDVKFKYSAPDNFVCVWQGVTFGIASGLPFTDATFKDPIDEIKWIEAQKIFIASFAERLEVYGSYLKAK